MVKMRPFKIAQGWTQ